jgi:putative component of membrane protein insertase Oxa1/YidC/SpoIIIJ protein YidD
MRRLAPLLLLFWIAYDVVIPPARAWDARVAVAAIDQYRQHVSPHLRGVVVCRFTPTCSYYGRETIRKRGFWLGGVKTLWRLARCGPWTRLHTSDPP